jgi:class 3 adenylate cyclase
VSDWTDLIGWPWPTEAGINAATGAELIQAYSRGVGRNRGSRGGDSSAHRLTRAAGVLSGAPAGDVTGVKYLGDGVVLLAAAPHAAVDAASQLIGELRGRVPLPAGAGVAHGRLLSHAGDCIGPAMNMASRLAELAAADAVLVDLEDWPAEPPGGSRRMVSPRGLRLERAVCALHVG